MRDRLAITTVAVALLLGGLLAQSAAAAPFAAPDGETPTLTNDALQPSGDAAAQLPVGLALLAAGLLVAAIALAAARSRTRPRPRVA